MCQETPPANVYHRQTLYTLQEHSNFDAFKSPLHDCPFNHTNILLCALFSVIVDRGAPHKSSGGLVISPQQRAAGTAEQRPLAGSALCRPRRVHAAPGADEQQQEAPHHGRRPRRRRRCLGRSRVRAGGRRRDARAVAALVQPRRGPAGAAALPGKRCWAGRTLTCCAAPWKQAGGGACTARGAPGPGARRLPQPKHGPSLHTPPTAAGGGPPPAPRAPRPPAPAPRAPRPPAGRVSRRRQQRRRRRQQYRRRRRRRGRGPRQRRGVRARRRALRGGAVPAGGAALWRVRRVRRGQRAAAVRRQRGAGGRGARTGACLRRRRVRFC